MKKVIIILLACHCTLLYSQNQTVRRFSLANGQPTADSVLMNLNLPIEFQFAKEFKDRSIKILDEKNMVVALKEGVFGKEPLTEVCGERIFSIIIDNEGDLKFPSEDDSKLTSGTYKLRIDSIEITFIISDSEVEKTDDKLKNDINYQPGYIYYDAIKLASENDTATILSILYSYGITNNNIGENNYINTIFSDYFSPADKTITKNSLITDLGNTDVTYFAAGLARFLAERTREELNEAFFSRMKDRLNDYPELKTIFPQTTSILNMIESYSYASVIQLLKEAFETDIQNLSVNLYDLTSLKENDCNGDEECEKRINKLREFFCSQEGHWVSLGLFSLKEGMQSTNPADLINTIVESTEFNSLKKLSDTTKRYADYNILSSIELGNLISKSLISKDENQVWISLKQMDSLLFRKEKAFKIYLGLLLAYEKGVNDKEKVIKFYKNDNDPITLVEIFKYENDIKRLIKNTHAAYNAANNAVNKIIAATDKSVDADPQALYNYYTTFTSSLKPIVHSQLFKKFDSLDIGAGYDKVQQYLNPSVDLSYHIATKKYSSAIYDATILLSALDTITIKVGNNEKREKVFEPVIKSFIKYGTLISTVANAQSSDEVKKAIEASVLPTGSYSIKRETSWSLSINSYVGAYRYLNKTYKKDTIIPILGLSAPIGFNISKGLCKNNDFGSIGLNLHIIDLGALVNYYLIKGDTASLANDFSVRLSNIFAPGFNISYNVPKTPLSIAWGGQYVPTLYKYQLMQGEKKLVSTNTFRWQISILVDIPLFNLRVWDFGR